MTKQLIRCATSVGANYRAACLAKSAPDMIAKLKVVEEEADEACYWIELLSESETLNQVKAKAMHTEAQELFRICAASVKTLRNRKT
jgi:four helix bundle protein